jgi:molybdopterin-binding protein
MAIFRGKVVSFTAGTWKASIRLDGSAGQSLDAIAVARNIASAEMTAGRSILLDTGDHSDPADFVITAVWGS